MTRAPFRRRMGHHARVGVSEIGQDFRNGPYDSKLFLPTGPGFATAIRYDKQGLRIVVPPEHGKKPPVGLVFKTV